MNADEVATFSDLEIIFTNVLNIALTLGGLTVFIMLIVGGFKYLTSGGDPKQTASASSTITMAVIGLLVAISTWFIFQLLNRITGINLLNFSLVSE